MSESYDFHADYLFRLIFYRFFLELEYSPEHFVFKCSTIKFSYSLNKRQSFGIIVQDNDLKCLTANVSRKRKTIPNSWVFEIEHITLLVNAFCDKNTIILYKTTVKANLYLYFTNHTLLHTGLWGSVCTDPCIVGIGTSWRQVVRFPLCRNRFWLY